ncbi:MAG: hypothetical protein Q9210_000375 [Variospora velana]
MPHLEESIRRKDASYWVVGLASNLCQELGLTQEATIDALDPQTGVRPNALELDMKRRLLWIIFSTETVLAHSLDRPSAFACIFDYTDLQLVEPVDDAYISKDGIVAGCPPTMKMRIAVHFLSMRFGSYTWPGDRSQKTIKIHGSGLDEVWIKGRFNTMIIFLYRPSSQIPNPSLTAARICFEACAFNVRMHRNQVATKSADLSRMWTQPLFMAPNTIVWAISYPEIRKDHSKSIVENHIMQAQECTVAAAERWPGSKPLWSCTKASSAHASRLMIPM